MPLTTQLLFDSQSASLGDADCVAIACADRSLTRVWLRQAVASCVRRLQHDHGVRAGQRVAGLSLNRPEVLVMLLALAHLRAIWVPLNWRLAAPELTRILSHCTPTLLVADAGWFEAASVLGSSRSVTVAKLVTLCAIADADTNIELLESEALDDDPTLLVYTSGTTGEPKGALHTQGNLIANMQAAVVACEITPHDRVLTALPLFHVGGLCIHTLPALAVGACVVLHERFDAGAVLASLCADRISLALVVPATLQALIEHPAWATTDLSGLRAIWAGSSIVPRRLIEAVHARGVPVCNIYGATETGPVSVVLGRAQAMSRVGASGWPALGVSLKLINAQADGEGHVGEIAVHAPNIAQYHWPQLYALDADGFFHTGDLAHRAADGCITVLGRVTELIICGGENVHPAEVEQVLREHPWVADCAVVGLADERWGEVVAAVIVPQSIEKLKTNQIIGQIGSLSPDPLTLLLSKLSEELHGFVATRVAKYKCPRRYLVVEALPKTALGKVQKHLLVKHLTEAAQP